jgi:CheY-like chemotaxis protein
MAHILLIDDDALLRDTLQQMLELDGHRVTLACDGTQGVTAYQQGGKGTKSGGFDLVITDILMPGQDGTEVIVKLRQQGATLPIIAISGGRRMLSPKFSLETAQLVGATSHLAKPFSRAILQSEITKVLSERRP